MSSISSRALCLALVLGLSQGVALARPAGDPTAAEAAFRDGRELMKRGAYAEACPRFEEALAHYASASAALNLGRCYAKLGRLAAARSMIERAKALNEETESAARKKEIARLAEEDLTDLAARIPHLVVRVSPAAEETVVARDGVEVPRGMLGRPIDVDPGTVTVRVTAPGFVPLERTAHLEEGETEILELALVREGSTSTPNAGRPVVKAAGAARPGAALDALWPWIVGGAGLASLGVAAGFAVDLAMAHGEVDELCPDATCPASRLAEAEAAAARWDRDVALLASFGAVGVGALVGSAIGLALGAPSRTLDVGAVVTPDAASLSFTIPIQ